MVLLFSLTVVWAFGPASHAETKAPANVRVEYPDGAAPDGGWPVFVLLHGYGTDKDDFAELCRIVAARGVVAVSVDAPQRVGPGRRSWGRADNNARVHEHVQEAVAFLRDDARFDTRRVHVGGFSQGAMHAVLLTLAWPELYGGVLAASSPGSAPIPAEWDVDEAEHPLFVIYGTQEPSSVRDFANRILQLWDDAGQHHQSFTHPGGHEFPLFWEKIMGGAVAWILHPKP